MRLILIVFFILVGSSVLSDEVEKDRFWILWEKYKYIGENCPNGSECYKRRKFSSRLFEPRSKEAIYRLYGMLDSKALSSGHKVDHPEAPRICQHNDAEVLLGFDPEKRRFSEKLDALRDLKGIHFDIRGLKAPKGFDEPFGERLQSQFKEKFVSSGIRFFDADEYVSVPGQPKLSVFFAHANPETGCNFSVFASLTQSALLTRDLNVKLTVGVWSFSTGPSAEYPNQNEYDAILRVADAFVRDFKRANKTY